MLKFFYTFLDEDVSVSDNELQNMYGVKLKKNKIDCHIDDDLNMSSNLEENESDNASQEDINIIENSTNKEVSQFSQKENEAPHSASKNPFLKKSHSGSSSKMFSALKNFSKNQNSCGSKVIVQSR